jgi:hypothetical protein
MCRASAPPLAPAPVAHRGGAAARSISIEDGERLRTSTENIGLAWLRDGTDLVRVGRPLRPELAARRYGAEFRGRQACTLLSEGGMTAAGHVSGTISCRITRADGVNVGVGGRWEARRVGAAPPAGW